MDARKRLGRRIREIRLEMELSQEEMAYRCDTHPSHIGQLERGERNPTLETLEGIAEGLNISIAELVDFEREPNVERHDALTDRLISRVPHMTAAEKEQLLVIIKAFEKWQK